VTDSDRPTDQIYRLVLEGIAEKSAAAAEKRDETREWLRDDPDWTWARWELAEQSGEVREYNWILRTLWRRYRPEGFDPKEFARFLWRIHIESNKRRSTTTGETARAATGAHHASSEALSVLQERTEVEYEDYGTTDEEAEPA